MQDTPFDYADDITSGASVLVTLQDDSNVYMEVCDPPFQKINDIYCIVGKLLPAATEACSIPTDEVKGYTLPEKKRTVH